MNTIATSPALENPLSRSIRCEGVLYSDLRIARTYREAVKLITGELSESKIPSRELKLLRAVIVDQVEAADLPSHLNLAPISVHHLIGIATTSLGKALGFRKDASALMNHFLTPNFKISAEELEVLSENPISFLEKVLRGERKAPPFVSEKNLKIVNNYYLDGHVVRAAGELEGIGLPTAENRRKYGVAQLSEWLLVYGLSRKDVEDSLNGARERRLKELEVPPVSEERVRELMTKSGLESFLKVSLKLDGGTLYPKNRFSLPLKGYFVEGKSYEEIARASGLGRNSINSVTREGVAHLVSLLREYGVSEERVRGALASIRQKATSREAREFVRGIKLVATTLDADHMPTPFQVHVGKYSRKGSDEFIFKDLGITRPTNVDSFVISPSLIDGALQLTFDGPGGYRRVIEWKGAGKKKSEGKSTVVDGSGKYRRERRINYSDELRRVLAREILGPSADFDLEKIKDRFQERPLAASIWLRTNLVPICWYPVTNSENYRWKLYRTSVDDLIYKELLGAIADGVRERMSLDVIRMSLSLSNRFPTNLKSLLLFMEFDPEEFKNRLLKIEESSKEIPIHLKWYKDRVSKLLDESHRQFRGRTWLTTYEEALDTKEVMSLLMDAGRSKDEIHWASPLRYMAELAPFELAFTYTRLRRDLRARRERPVVIKGFEKLDKGLGRYVTKRTDKFKDDYRKHGFVRGNTVRHLAP